MVEPSKNIVTADMVSWMGEHQASTSVGFITNDAPSRYYYYRLTSEYSHASRKRKGLPWFSKASTDDIHATANSVTTAQQALTEQTRSKGDPLNFSKGKKRKRKVKMSRTVILDLDEKRKSDRAEVAILHSDIIHNPNNA